MPHQNQLTDLPFSLQSRAVLAVTGDDASLFLQNIFTNDVTKIADGILQYSLLLTPQGQLLRDVFIFKKENVYYIDVEKSGMADLVRRMTMYKLRSKVDIAETDMKVYAGGDMFADPRYDMLGYRSYLHHDIPARDEQGYVDFCISLGIPCGEKTIMYGKDFAHDANLDALNAFDWNKGCFIGQEVAARMHHRGLAKKRLVILSQDFANIDNIRTINSDRTQALSLMRLDEVASHPQAALPDYLRKLNT